MKHRRAHGRDMRHGKRPLLSSAEMALIALAALVTVVVLVVYFATR